MAETSQSANLEFWLRLSLAPDVGPILARKLLDQFGSPESIFNSSADEILSLDGMGPKRLEGLLAGSTAQSARREFELAEKHGVQLLTLEDESYPRSVAALPHPPLVLYVKGDLRPTDRLALAVVGPRNPSSYARIMATSLIPPLCARGIVIVSGLAAGIDAESHLAALDGGGRTIAVLGHSLDQPIYPSSNKGLATRILREERGALISVFPFGTGPDAGNFPKRNEIIAALSLGVLVIEAGEKSGALITASHGAEFGRTVMACPGDATRANARGSNRLIAEGAVLVQKSDDVISALANELRQGHDEVVPSTETTNESLRSPTARKNAGDAVPRVTRPEDPLGARIWDLLDAEHRPIDAILDHCATAGFTQGEVVHKLLLMEMSGVIRQLPGRVFTLIQ